MLDKGDGFAEWISYLWVVGLSVLGGIVHYLNKMRESGTKFSWLMLVAEMLTSGFVGIITFFLCDAAGLGWQMTAAMVGISGHMGTRAIFKFEKLWGKTL